MAVLMYGLVADLPVPEFKESTETAPLRFAFVPKPDRNSYTLGAIDPTFDTLWQLRNLASEGPEQKRGPAKRSLDHDSRADAVESAMSVSSSSMSSPTGVVYKPASLDHEVRARVSSMSMPTRARIMAGL